MKLKLFAGFLLAVAVSYTGNSQSIYRLKYKSPVPDDTVTYDAFFAIYDNGGGFVRVNYTSPETNKDVRVEMEIQEQYAEDNNGAIDTSKLVYEIIKTTIKKGDTATAFTPVSFWFKMNTENNLFEPGAVAASAGNIAADTGRLLSARLLTGLDSIKKTAALFFTREDEFYKNLTAPKSRGDILTAEEKKTKLFLTIVASTNDEDIGASCLKDARKAIETFDSIAKFLGIRNNLIIDTVYGDRYSKKNVLSAISKIKPAPVDIVIFYYSGHGFTNRKEKTKEYPFLDLRDPRIRPRPDPKANTLNIEDIYKMIKLKKARMNLVISDCCNDTIEAKNIVAPPPPRPARPRGDIQFNAENVKQLFMNKNEKNLSFLMTAARKDERASSNNKFGGFFTHFFLESLKSYLVPNKGKANWIAVMATAQEKTISKADNTYCPLPSNPKNICHQTPRSNMLPF